MYPEYHKKTIFGKHGLQIQDHKRIKLMKRRTFLKQGTITTASLLLFNDLMASSANRSHMSPKIKPIAGSWFEFLHGSEAEGKYWNPALPGFTEAQWKAKVLEIKETGMEYLVLMSVANNGKTFYPSKLQPRYDYACSDPLEAILTAADDCGIKFFVSNDFWVDWRETDRMMKDPKIALMREKAMEEIAGKYGHHKSFYGWYYPNETGISGVIDDTTLKYVNHCTRIARRLMPESVNLIAPYGTNSVRADDAYVRQLEKLDIDIIAYQDEIGVRKTKAGDAGQYFEALYKAHLRAGRSRLWADMEIFDFEGDVYKSALVPADFDRILKQMEDISPFVEHILIYQYMGIMNKPGSAASIGHPNSEALYNRYMSWLKSQRS
jgi:hypothetical protein